METCASATTVCDACTEQRREESASSESPQLCGTNTCVPMISGSGREAGTWPRAQDLSACPQISGQSMVLEDWLRTEHSGNAVKLQGWVYLACSVRTH